MFKQHTVGSQSINMPLNAFLFGIPVVFTLHNVGDMQVHQWYNFIGWETFKLRHRKRLLIGG
jgi:hypothetical protein